MGSQTMKQRMDQIREEVDLLKAELEPFKRDLAGINGRIREMKAEARRIRRLVADGERRITGLETQWEDLDHDYRRAVIAEIRRKKENGEI